ncbi:hypothetical protein [Butyrivibrio sp. JL13D10]|uniref:hypothetical protein n=1 Tax=Butyrivibrio sp. JL13D10 TaxID=3236815 RepID=UPI0038B63195
MNDDFKYLSDEELNKLIESTEESGLLEAPISFEAEVLKRLAKSTRENIISREEYRTENSDNDFENRTISFEDKKKEFSKFRFQVCMAMAAAILVLIIAPFLSANEGLNAIRKKALAGQDNMRQQTNYVSDFFGNHVMSESMGNVNLGIGTVNGSLDKEN